ncbi:Hint domain-containing protein [Blastopirellula sp. JC732]|uniref:Hint domain-containing protein n=1 Tax=Blastopirellula sediminis TaxID=2894196 RepID=A0A9X1SEN0_9BACT|nr:Hint domain-containing protein [Blastopirellula sediminis]MCC9607819.1 Hint domain-containing protein [Blastopirellula sediminis]MCC9627388.1 Hint domain-containing protein [Blastopirellula sediminis]
MSSRKYVVVAVLALLGLFGLTAADSLAAETYELASDVFTPGIRISSAPQPICKFQLAVRKVGDDRYSGTLTLTQAAPAIDDFGNVNMGNAAPPLKLDCTMGFVKKQSFTMNPGGPPPETQEWMLYRLTGPKISNPLYISAPDGSLRSCRLVIWSDKPAPLAVVWLREPPLPLPCHPGCFPAGTMVVVPGGEKRVDAIQVGDPVMTVGADGNVTPQKVADVFVTRNRLVEVIADAGKLTTTETQPLCHVTQGFRAAGELQAGDRIWLWRDEKKSESVVREVKPTDRIEPVFNLVVDEGVVFIAGGFLARCKPPAIVEGDPVASKHVGAVAKPGHAHHHKQP